MQRLNSASACKTRCFTSRPQSFKLVHFIRRHQTGKEINMNVYLVFVTCNIMSVCVQMISIAIHIIVTQWPEGPHLLYILR